jgi:cyclophilin family peptidyl-prolyl cis-trans isomerase
MKNKIVQILLFTSIFALFNPSFMLKSQTIVLLETTLGNIKIRLYDETPNHRDNFIMLVRSGFYDNLLFHRVINHFMIQTGDPDSKNARPDQHLGSGGPSYTLPAEILPRYFHKKGAVAAARQGDAVNPEKKSSGSQFYIVQGNILSNAQLDAMEKSSQHPAFTQEERQAYTTIGGTPHLDTSYTVFGEVTEGLDIVDKIASSSTSQSNRPISDIRIIHASIIP